MMEETGGEVKFLMNFTVLTSAVGSCGTTIDAGDTEVQLTQGVWSPHCACANIKFSFRVRARSPGEYEDKENWIPGDLCYAMKGREKPQR